MSVVSAVLCPARWRLQTQLALVGFLLLMPSLSAGYALLEVGAERPDRDGQRTAQSVGSRSAARLDEALRGLVSTLDVAAGFPDVQQMNQQAGEPLLRRLSAASPYLARTTVADRDGSIRLDSSTSMPDRPVPASIRDRAYFHTVMSTGWPALEPDPSENGDPGFLVAVPLRDQSQQTVGVVTAELRTGELADLLADVVHRQNVGLLLIGAGDQLLLAINWPPGGEGHGPGVAATAQNRSAAALQGAYPTAEVALSALPVRLLVIYASDNGLGPLGSPTARVTALAAMILAALVGSRSLSRRLARPFTALAEHVSVPSHNSDPAAGGSATREAAVLARAFTEMRSTLDRRTQELDQSREQAARQAERLSTLAREVPGAREAERKRIALELHDTVARQIAGALFTLEGSASDASSLAVQQACLALRRAHTDIHRAIFTLRPPALGGTGLAGALRGLVNAFCGEFNGTVRMSCRGTLRRLTPAAEMAVYRAVQEGLRNIATHSGAQGVELTLAFAPEGTCVTLHDDGKGFDTGRIDVLPAEHIGILGIRQRLEDIGGRLTVASSLDAGTTLTFSMPPACSVAEASPAMELSEQPRRRGGDDARAGRGDRSATGRAAGTGQAA